MKKVLVCFIFLLIFSSLVVSVISPNDDSTIDERYEKVEDLTEKIPLDNSGNIDEEKLNSSVLFVGSKMNERVKNINLWLKENVSWLSFVFRMIPSISWLFAFNLFFIVVGLTYLIVNYRIYLGAFFEKEIYGFYLGIVIFVILLFSNTYLFLAKGAVKAMEIFWNQILPWGFFIAVILIVVFIIVLIALAYLFPEALFWIGRMVARLFGKKISKRLVENIANKAAEKAEKAARKAEEQSKVIEELSEGVSES